MLGEMPITKPKSKAKSSPRPTRVLLLGDENCLSPLGATVELVVYTGDDVATQSPSACLHGRFDYWVIDCVSLAARYYGANEIYWRNVRTQRQTAQQESDEAGIAAQTTDTTIAQAGATLQSEPAPTLSFHCPLTPEQRSALVQQEENAPGVYHWFRYLLRREQSGIGIIRCPSGQEGDQEAIRLADSLATMLYQWNTGADRSGWQDALEYEEVPDHDLGPQYRESARAELRDADKLAASAIVPNLFAGAPPGMCDVPAWKWLPELAVSILSVTATDKPLAAVAPAGFFNSLYQDADSVDCTLRQFAANQGFRVLAVTTYGWPCAFARTLGDTRVVVLPNCVDLGQVLGVPPAIYCSPDAPLVTISFIEASEVRPRRGLYRLAIEVSFAGEPALQRLVGYKEFLRLLFLCACGDQQKVIAYIPLPKKMNVAAQNSLYVLNEGTTIPASQQNALLSGLGQALFATASEKEVRTNLSDTLTTPLKQVLKGKLPIELIWQRKEPAKDPAHVYMVYRLHSVKLVVSPAAIVFLCKEAPTRAKFAAGTEQNKELVHAVCQLISLSCP